MKNISGYVFTIGSSAICWNAKKLEVVAQSTPEVEYISMTAVINQVIWLNKLLADLGQEQSSPTELCYDNKSCHCYCLKSGSTWQHQAHQCKISLHKRS